MSPVINISHENIDNRSSQMQAAILEILADRRAVPPTSSFIGDLPRTGDIVDALGRSRDKAGYASVSRSLKRLWKAGKVQAYSSILCARGNGYRWSLTA